MHHDVTLQELEEHLVDINQPSYIPVEVMDFFWKWKEEQGSIATGIAYISKKGWFIFSPARLDNEIIQHFPDNLYSLYRL